MPSIIIIQCSAQIFIHCSARIIYRGQCGGQLGVDYIQGTALCTGPCALAAFVLAEVALAVDVLLVVEVVVGEVVAPLSLV